MEENLHSVLWKEAKNIGYATTYLYPRLKKKPQKRGVIRCEKTINNTFNLKSVDHLNLVLEQFCLKRT